MKGLLEVMKIVVFLDSYSSYVSIYFYQNLKWYIPFIVCKLHLSKIYILFIISYNNNIVPNFLFFYLLFNSSETQMTLGGNGSEDSSCKPIFSTLPETNILNVVKVGRNSFFLSLAQGWNHLVLWLMVLKQNHECFTM